jgi:hypothetical protein
MTDNLPSVSATTKKPRRKKPAKSGIPYETATSMRSQDETKKLLLEKIGCEEAGFYDKPATHEVLLQFKLRGYQIQRRLSAKGWAAFYLKRHPWHASRRRGSQRDYEQAALKQGYIAVNSMLRDWVKSAVTEIECGCDIETVFMQYMLTNDGRPLHERIKELQLLPEPEEPKVVALPLPKKVP